MLMYVINHKLIEHIPPHYNILSLISFPSVFFYYFPCFVTFLLFMDVLLQAIFSRGEAQTLVS